MTDRGVALAARLEATIARIAAPNEQAGRDAQDALDRKTKPRGSLGRLEALARQIAAARGEPSPGELRPTIVVAAGDHGIAAEGVSAYPQDVTRQMLANFASGGAAICVLARQARADLVVVDAGVMEPLGDPRVRELRAAPGTANATVGAAMTLEQALEAVANGIDLAAELAEREVNCVALGEMGIGNTTAASALCAALLERDPADLCGPGTGLDAEGIRRKVAVVQRALDVNRPNAADPMAVLAALGGLEIAFLVGLAIGAAAERMVVVLDGFIIGAVALVATRLAPKLRAYLIAAHRSPEPGHRLVLEALALAPLFDLGLRLGEGSGAALALPLIASSLAILNEMTTFDQAGVTDAGR